MRVVTTILLMMTISVSWANDNLLRETELLMDQRDFYAAVDKASEAVAFYSDDETLAKLYFIRGQAQRIRRNYSQAFADYEVAFTISPDDTEVIREYGNALTAGYAGEAYWQEGSELLLKAANLGDAEAQYRLGVNYLIRDRSKISAAVDLLEQAAQQKHVQAMLMLAQFYQRGQYVQKDWQSALHHYQRLAALNHPEGLFYLALAHYSGRGVAQDFVEYERLIALAAEQGHLVSLSSAASLLSGENDAEATRLFFSAANLGYSPAKINLGLAYLRGFGVKQNFNEAQRWFRDSQEYAQAQDFLGVMSLLGLGVDADKNEAYEFFKKSSGIGTRSVDQQSYAYMAVLSQQGVGDADEGFYERWLTHLSQLKSESELNGVVWALSTSPIDELNRPEIALHLASLLEQTTTNPAYLDSIAAALALNGEFKKAKLLQKQVVADLKGTREYAEARVRYKGYKRKHAWSEDYKITARAPRDKHSTVAIFSGEIIRPSAGRTKNAPSIFIGNDARLSVPILVKEVSEGSLPFAMQEYATFVVPDVAHLTRSCGGNPNVQMPAGVHTFRLTEHRTNEGWQYEFDMDCDLITN